MIYPPLNRHRPARYKPNLDAQLAASIMHAASSQEADRRPQASTTNGLKPLPR